MSGSDHTPGPWEAILWSEGRWVIKADDRNVFICARDQFPSKPKESDANARLIAAAPDLLKSLVGYMEAVETMNAAMKDGLNVHGAISSLVGWEDMAREAIAKAEGRLDLLNTTERR